MAQAWRSSNVPIPEAHLALVFVGVMLSMLWPLSVGLSGPWATGAGILLIVVGVTFAAWATSAAGQVVLAEPERLVTTGPYRISRHPMYVGWTLLYLGMLAIMNSAWFAVLLPGLAIWVHRISVREERRLLLLFGSVYEDYQRQVRRYL